MTPVTGGKILWYSAATSCMSNALSQQLGFDFPFCYDESQSTAQAYTATCTPDFFLFDQKRRLIYRGQLDDSRPGKGLLVTGVDLRAAIDAALADESAWLRAKGQHGLHHKVEAR